MFLFEKEPTTAANYSIAQPLRLQVKDPSDPVKCGELREYFEYDRDYPDDNRICQEVQDLQVSRMSTFIPPNRSTR